MLKKLFYYDFRALSRYLLPTVCIVLGVCLLACIFLSVFMANSDFVFDPSHPFGGLLSLSVAMVYVFLVLGLVGAGLAFYIIYILRVRTHMYGDEGYLTLAIPATPHQFTLSKLFSGTLWCYIMGFTIIIGLFISIFVPIMFIPGMMEGSGGADIAVPPPGVTEVISSILYPIAYLLVVPVAQVMFLQTTVSVGSLLAGKSHIGISILFYFGVNFAMSIVQSIFTDILLYGDLVNKMDYGALMIFDACVVILLYGGLGVGMYFLNVHLLRRKVNLE